MLTTEFSCGSGQAVSRAHSAHQVIDWQHWSQLLAESAEATVPAHTQTYTYTNAQMQIRPCAQRYLLWCFPGIKRTTCVVAGLLFFIFCPI